LNSTGGNINVSTIGAGNINVSANGAGNILVSTVNGSGDITVSSDNTLDLSGSIVAVSASSDVNITAPDVNVNSIINATGTVNLYSNINATGTVNLNGAVGINGNLTTTGTVQIYGSENISNNLSVHSINIDNVSNSSYLNFGHSSYSQLTSTITPVPINTPSGLITMQQSITLASYTPISFDVTNWNGFLGITSNSVILVNFTTISTVGLTVSVCNVSNNHFTIKICNLNNVQITDTPTIAYLIC